MASLEELLKKEGFHGGKLKHGANSRNFTPDSKYSRRERSRSDAFSSRSKSVISSSSASVKYQSNNHRRSMPHMRKASVEIKTNYVEKHSDSQEIEEEIDEKYHVSYPESIVEEAEEKEQEKQSERYIAERNIETIQNPLYLELKLDEVAIKVLISILTGYLRRFFKDKDFQASFYQNCMSCLGIDDQSNDGVISNLKQAIQIIERTLNGTLNGQELKRAFLQLSVITGLSSNGLEDKYTNGIPNALLSSCAHLYLSVVYKFQKKDKASAKHILQVFIDCPSQARNKLLSGLWDRLILPHLYHLKEWYDNEAMYVARTKNKVKHMKLLEEMYSNLLDAGTYKFGVYYKAWLVDEAATPDIPTIVPPKSSFKGLSVENLSSSGSDEFRTPGISNSSQAVVSKSLYDSVFRHAPKENEVAYKFASENYELEEHSGSTSDDIPTSDIISVDEWKEYNGSRNNDMSSIREMKVETIDGISSHNIAKENQLTLQKIAEAAFNPQLADYNNLPELQSGRSIEIDKGSFFSSIPEHFVCPITNQLFCEPVTIESGQTYERKAIKEWFDQGKKTCPVTKRQLESTVLPVTNFVLKRVIDGWKSEHCRNLSLLANQMVKKEDNMLKYEVAVFIIEQLLTSFSMEQKMENARCLISLGGLQFLTTRLQLGNMEEKIRVSSLLLCCIKADGFCRNYLANNIEKRSILEVLHCKQANARTNAVLLLTELICLNRRTAIDYFISGFRADNIVSTMHILLLHLQSSPTEERVMVSVLLLHFDLMVEPRRYSIYREEAVDSITLALNQCLTDIKHLANCKSALLMLGGHFSFSGEILTETWMLKKAGLDKSSSTSSSSYNVESDDIILEEEDEEEEKEKEEWMKTIALVLLSSGKGSFLDKISECLSSEKTELVGTCVITVAWLSHALASLPLSQYQLSAFINLLPSLTEMIKNGQQIEHRVLASLSIFNFSKISECRVLLRKVVHEIHDPLRTLAESNSISKMLYDDMLGGNQELQSEIEDAYYSS